MIKKKWYECIVDLNGHAVLGVHASSTEEAKEFFRQYLRHDCLSPYTMCPIYTLQEDTIIETEKNDGVVDIDWYCE